MPGEKSHIGHDRPLIDLAYQHRVVFDASDEADFLADAAVDETHRVRSLDLGAVAHTETAVSLSKRIGE